MAPQEKIKSTTSKPIPMKAMKTPMKPLVPNTPLKVVTNTLNTRQRTASAPKTPKPPRSGPITPSKPSAPSWKRRPLAAHSGVPVPEKMRKLFDKIRKEKLAAAENSIATSAPN